jgi:hypothetical protein
MEICGMSTGDVYTQYSMMTMMGKRTLETYCLGV